MKGATLKQIHLEQFLNAVRALRECRKAGDKHGMVIWSVELHSLKGHVPRSYRKLANS